MDRVSASVAACCVLLVFLVHSSEATGLKDQAWERPGCHKVGHTRKVAIPDCVEFYITTHACRGFCESWSVPSEMDTVVANPHQVVTSVGQCCNIMETEDVTAEVLCKDGIRNLVFKSAKSCSCYHCKKD
ncbi:thyrostimulin alpha-2 subunit [Neocloeon triangulifer]|uniref:thyrostimulin alpha-2 subunit n=1 Tax=Neocloeon triangulifer TaxID=2078957 RepID=UPI00286F11CC|nr:thyrostimulin alpha-2 subunit [Neocloeon triangulifer]